MNSISRFKGRETKPLKHSCLVTPLLKWHRIACNWVNSGHMALVEEKCRTSVIM